MLLLLGLLLLGTLLGLDLLAVASTVAVAGGPVDRTELGLERRGGRARLPGRSADVPDSLGLAASTVGAVVGGIVVGDVVHVAVDDEHGGGDGLARLHVGENILLQHFILGLGLLAAGMA